jgi:hypothetical protein
MPPRITEILGRKKFSGNHLYRFHNIKNRLSATALKLIQRIFKPDLNNKKNPTYRHFFSHQITQPPNKKYP